MCRRISRRTGFVLDSSTSSEFERVERTSMFTPILSKLLKIAGTVLCCASLSGCVLVPFDATSMSSADLLQVVAQEELSDEGASNPGTYDDLPIPAPALAPEAMAGITDERQQRGRAAFEQSCTQCHEAEQALVVKKTYVEWVDTINEMANMEDSQVKTVDIVPIATYLSQRTDEQIAAAQAAAERQADTRDNSKLELHTTDMDYGEVAFNTSCVECHDSYRSLVKKKTYSGWMATIRNMVERQDADIDAGDFAPIATYLANRTDQEIARSRQEQAALERESNDATGSEDTRRPDVSLSSRGKSAFYQSCVECHDAERSLSAEKSFGEWMSTIRRMAAKDDADVDPNDYRPIATFLSERTADEIEKSKAEAKDESGDKSGDSNAARKFDPSVVAAGKTAFQKSCIKCHDAQRSLSKRKSVASWRATVKRMAAKDGADVRPGDFEAISVYLASTSAGDGGVAEDGGEVSPWTFSTTLSTLERVSSDPIENPGFFVDAWVGADWQSDGPLRATVMACTSCHSDRNSSKGFTLELVEASATLDLKQLLFDKYHSLATKQAARNMTSPSNTHGEMPTATSAVQHEDSPVSTSADLKMGRFVVPFGAYSAFSHPGSYRTITNPLMFNMGRRLDTGGAFQPVLPAPYSDEGLNLRLGLREYCDRSYTLDLFAVNGLQGTAAGTNFNLSRSYSDNNRTPAVGGRYTLGNQVFRFGASGMIGRLQNDGSPELDYHLLGADAVVNTERLRAYFEYAFRREQAGPLNDNEVDGYVVELEWRLKERLGFLTRYDTLEHEVASAGTQSIDRFTWGFNLALQRAGLLLLNHEHWMLDDRSDIDVVGVRWVTTF